MAAVAPPPVIPPIVRKKFRRELGAELKEAVVMLLEFFNKEPSLVVKSPHGAHVYWCLEEKEPWFEVRPVMVKVRRAWQREAQERGITDIGIEVLPSIRKPLRVPRKDRLIEPGSLEPMEKPEGRRGVLAKIEKISIRGTHQGRGANREGGECEEAGATAAQRKGRAIGAGAGLDREEVATQREHAGGGARGRR